MSTLNSRGGWGTGMGGEGGEAGTANGISARVLAMRERDKTTRRDSERSGVPNEGANTFAKHTMSEADDSFKLDEYAKPRRADLEAGEDKCGAVSSPTRVSDATVAGKGMMRHIEIARLQLPPRGTRAGASNKWSITFPSVGDEEK
ncbi:hypothetical protein FRC10_006280 [Ceratobasidium sp. 414]|nr:hypothetical protein FRC10_006280 [Ceratobasidium sp. 414]